MYQVLIERHGEVEVYQSGLKDQWAAEMAFLRAVENTISNFDEYRAWDIDVIVEQQYENFGSGRIYFEEV